MKPSISEHIDELLPEAWVDRDVLLFVNSDDQVFASAGFVVHGQPVSNVSLEFLAGWRAAATAMLNSIDPSAHLQCYWTVENDYRDFIEGHRKGLLPNAHPIARVLHGERIKSFEKMELNNDLRFRKLFVFVNFEPRRSSIQNQPPVSAIQSIRKEHRIILNEWDAARMKLSQILEMARHPFETCGMNTKPLSGADLKRLYRRVLAPMRTRLGVPFIEKQTESHLWTETVLGDVVRHPPFLALDDHFHAFLSMSNIPPETQGGFLIHLFNLSHPDYSLILTLRTTDKQKEIHSLQSDYGSKRSLQRARNAAGRETNIEMETQADEIYQEIRTLTQSPQQIYHTQLNLHLWAPTKDELRRRVDEAVLKAGYCNGIQLVLEEIAAPEALRASLPGWTREDRLDRFHVMKSANAADFIPIHTDFIGTGRPQLLFPTPENGLMTAHVFTENRPFHNVVVGETGGGKTFLIQSILSQLMSQGLDSITLISTKDEFGPLTSVYGGQKFSFRKDQPVFVNPCAIQGDTPSQDELAGMLAILESILGEEPNDGNRKVRQSRILKALQIGYSRHGRSTRIRHLIHILRESWDFDNNDELKRLAMILEPYGKGGLYGEFFDSNTRKPLDLGCNLKFFDFSGIHKDRNLSSVMMMALASSEALRLQKLPKSARKALVLDECWAFVNSTAGGDFIENALRV